MIVALVITDGRMDCIEQTIPSAEANLQGSLTRKIIYDDSGDPAHRSRLHARFPRWEIIHAPDGRQGFGGAIAWAWDWILEHTSEPYIFHLEDDFTFNEPVDLDACAGILDRHPHVAQVAMLRQPWNDEERAAGGIIACHPDDFTQAKDPYAAWVEQRRFFTTNPSLYRRSLCWRGWPTEPHSEGLFSIDLFRTPHTVSAFLGRLNDPPRVTHIGAERVGTGY